ncbi:unnamed protein product [Cuscuta campestris]|uniref:Uncharacterized protein n=1 Tax=Cuscuta campestris TaxID=132261 RepID=A0A484KC76_9ASTE|nr:unnamed protein product [Cuscuta campestris]
MGLVARSAEMAANIARAIGTVVKHEPKWIGQGVKFKFEFYPSTPELVGEMYAWMKTMMVRTTKMEEIIEAKFGGDVPPAAVIKPNGKGGEGREANGAVAKANRNDSGDIPPSSAFGHYGWMDK